MTAYNADGVATSTASAEDLVNKMTALKDEENNAIYTDSIVTEEGTITSKYPLLISNLEKNPELNA